MRWSDGHTSMFTHTWLKQNSSYHDSPHNSLHARQSRRRVLTAQSTLPEVFSCVRVPHFTCPSCLFALLSYALQVQYQAFMKTKKGFFATLEHMCNSGLCILRNVPIQEKMVRHVAEKIAPISHRLLYGDVWDVKPTSNVRFSVTLW